MTIDQIISIISLLLAFGVPQPVVSNVQTILMDANPSATTTSSSASALPPQLAPQAPEQPTAAPVRVDTSLLAQRWAAAFPKGLHGVVDLWTDQLVMQGGQDIKAGSSIVYSIDDVVLGSPSGILGNYSFPLDTTKYPNGKHEIGIGVDDGAGSLGGGTLIIDIEN